MTLRDLTVRLRKSFSGLFSSDSDDNVGSTSQSASDREALTRLKSEVVNLENSGCNVSDTVRSCPHHSASSSSHSPPKRNTLLGNLRRESFRSIGSLRSLRLSPARHKEKPDIDSAIPLTPLSSAQSKKPSLVLNFKESPPDRPIFEITPRPSTSSSLIVQHSSPLAIPISGEATASISKVDTTSMLPDGTVPPSPAPLKIAMDAEPHSNTPPKILRRTSTRTFGKPATWGSDVKDKTVSERPLLTPMPGTNLTFDELLQSQQRSSEDHDDDHFAGWCEFSRAVDEPLEHGEHSGRGNPECNSGDEKIIHLCTARRASDCSTDTASLLSQMEYQFSNEDIASNHSSIESDIVPPMTSSKNCGSMSSRETKLDGDTADEPGESGETQEDEMRDTTEPSHADDITVVEEAERAGIDQIPFDLDGTFENREQSVSDLDEAQDQALQNVDPRHDQQFAIRKMSTASSETWERTRESSESLEDIYYAYASLDGQEKLFSGNELQSGMTVSPCAQHQVSSPMSDYDAQHIMSGQMKQERILMARQKEESVLGPDEF